MLRRQSIVIGLLGAGAFGQQVLGPAEIGGGADQLRLVLGKHRLVPLQGGARHPIIEPNQKVAGLDHLPVLDRNGGHLAGNPRPDLDDGRRLDGAEDTYDDGKGRFLRLGDGDRNRRAGLGFAAAIAVRGALVVGVDASRGGLGQPAKFLPDRARHIGVKVCRGRQSAHHRDSSDQPPAHCPTRPWLCTLSHGRRFVEQS